jgi:hypothetical protein
MDDTLVGGIAQGNGESERIGRKITVRSLHIRGQIVLPAVATSTATADRVRIIVYQDTQCNGTPATVTGNGGLLASAAIDAYNNLVNTGRFRTLMDKVYNINATAAANTNTTTYTSMERTLHWKFNKRCATRLEYSASTPGITDLRTNNYGVLAISDQGRCTLSYLWRVRYSDM